MISKRHLFWFETISRKLSRTVSSIVFCDFTAAEGHPSEAGGGTFGHGGVISCNAVSLLSWLSLGKTLLMQESTRHRRSEPFRTFSAQTRDSHSRRSARPHAQSDFPRNEPGSNRVLRMTDGCPTGLGYQLCLQLWEQFLESFGP